MYKKILAVTIASLGGILFYFSPGVNSNKDITSFSVNSASGTINQVANTVSVVLPTGTNLTHLTPIFTATGPNVTVIGQPQYSGITSHNFESEIPYVVHASDGSLKTYEVDVTTASGNSDSYFQYFGLNTNTNGGLSYGTLSGSNISITVPSNTNLSALSSYFTYIGTGVQIGSTAQISNVTVNNFSSPITYKVLANDGTIANYNVTVTPASGTSDNITNFAIITGNGTFPCNINGVNINCGVPNGTLLSHLIATYQSTGSLVQVGTTNQVSGLSINNFTSPVTYKVTSGSGSTSKNYDVNVTNYQTFLDVKNLGETIFDNTTYNVAFNIVNNESATINNINDTVIFPHPFVWTQTGDSCKGTNLSVESPCSVTGTLNVPKTYGSAAVQFTLVDGSGNVHASYNKIVTAIPQLTELEPSIESPEIYAAYRFTNAGAHRLYTTAAVNGFNICFDNNHVGTITTQTQSWSTCAVEMTRGNDTLFIPAYPGVGGKVLMSVDNTIPDGPTPSVTATSPSNTYFTKWQQVEYGGGLTGASPPVATFFNLNPTNVDFTSIPVTISTVITGDVGPYTSNSYAAQGILFSPNTLTQNVLSAMQGGLATIPNANNPSWNGLTQLTQDKTAILRILSPSSIFPFMSESSSQFYFNGAFYNQYISDLWSYYTDNQGGHYLYTDDTPVAKIVESTVVSCILQCQVTHTDNLMHCAYSSGTCPTNTNSGTLDGEYAIAVGESSPAGMTEFTPEDFVSAAGVNTVTTFGVNQTYRSLTGENIVSGQSVGFLPFCSNTNFVFGSSSFAANMNLYYNPQYSCLPNYTSYTVAPIDQYSAINDLYFIYYNYGYSDTLNQSGSIYSYSNELYPFTIDTNYQ